MLQYAGTYGNHGMLLEMVEGHATAYGCCKRHKLAPQNPFIAVFEYGLVPHCQHYMRLLCLDFSGPGGDWCEGRIVFEEESLKIARSKDRL